MKAIRLRIVLALVCLLGPWTAALAQNDASTVIDLARFASWPDSAEHGLTFRICLRDDDPAFGKFMGLKGTEIGGRPVTLHSVEPSSIGARPCHILYFSAGLASQDMLAVLQKQAVLTVSPQADFARDGGLVELNREDGSLSILIDRETVVTHPLQINAQLLDIANEVEP